MKRTNHFLVLIGRCQCLRVALLMLLGVALTACNGLPTNTMRLADAAQSQPAQKKVAGEITHVLISPIGHGKCSTAPVTFGQPFVKGDLPRGQTLHAEYKGHALPTQINVKARNDDGSVRHAIITIQAPCGGSDRYVALVKGRAATPSAANRTVSLQDVLDSGFNSSISLDADGKTWRLNARDLLKKVSASGHCQASGKIFCKHWLTGPLASEWVVGAPLQDASGSDQQHLAAYFAVRAYGPAPVSRVRVDVVVENDWAYGPKKTNITYAPTITVGGKTVYAPSAFTHYVQARWHHVAWWGKSAEAPLYAALDPAYLQSTPAVPQYENINLSRKMMAHARQACAPMHSCDQTPHMENTGAQAAIGPLPQWSAAFVIDPAYRMYRWMLANSDALGAYDVHYRTRDTGLPLSIEAHPCATTLWPARQESCKVPPHKDDRFPHCESKAACKTPFNANVAHHPAPAYVAYLATGDWYYASELTFWADWAVFWQNPDYRGYAKGLVNGTQVRGQAWMLRTLGDAAYLLPNDNSHKTYFNEVVVNNMAWYNKHYTDNPKANTLGAIANWHAVIYPLGGQSRVGIAPWQQSFFTWAVGNLADQGFTGAKKFSDWVSRFQIGQMTAPGYCWEEASAYTVRIRNSQKAPFYSSYKQVYDNSFPKLKDVGCSPGKLNAAITRVEGKQSFHYPPRTMVGYPKSGTGFVANFQIGLAAAATSDVPQAKRAWKIFENRATLTNYSWSPQFAVLPSVPAGR
jgi:hypothetical protein